MGIADKLDLTDRINPAPYGGSIDYVEGLDAYGHPESLQDPVAALRDRGLDDVADSSALLALDKMDRPKDEEKLDDHFHPSWRSTGNYEGNRIKWWDSYLKGRCPPEELERVRDAIVRWEDSLGDLLTAEQVAGRVGPNVELLELPTSVGIPLYPAYQFDGDGVLEGLVNAYREFDPEYYPKWMAASWFRTPQPELDNRTPIECLRAGRAHDVQIVARDVNGRQLR